MTGGFAARRTSVRRIFFQSLALVVAVAVLLHGDRLRRIVERPRIPASR